MSTFNNKHGHEWTREERQTRQRPLRQAKTLHNRVQSNVWRIGLHLPTFKDRAEEAFRALAPLKCVVGLDLSARGRKYLPLSPDEFDQIIRGIPEMLKPWKAFEATPEFAAASRLKCREIEAHNARVLAEVARAQPVFDLLARGDVVGAIELAAEKGML